MVEGHLGGGMTETPYEALARLRGEWSRASSASKKNEIAAIGSAVAVVADLLGDDPQKES